jgi:uncharacterized membrane protein YphA (DoxX/SURF4 family)
MNKNQDLGLFLLRLGLAAVFFFHGLDKLNNIDGIIGFFSSLGIPAIFAYLVAIIETLGGLALFVGLWVEKVSLALAIVMLFAIYLVKFSKGFFGGYEFDLLLLLGALAISMMGSGSYTVKHWLKK